jgi:hypothetical protein
MYEFLLVFPLLYIILLVLCMKYETKRKQDFGGEKCGLITEVVGWFLPTPIFVFTITMSVWGIHAANLGTISSNNLVVLEAAKQSKALNDRLNSFKYPQAALLNRDTPVSSIVETMSDWQRIEARAAMDIAEAKVEIDRRRHFIFSGVIRVVGDYK